MELRKLFNTKKGQIGKKIDSVVVVIITVVVLFLVFAGIVPEAQTAGASLGDAQICSESGGFFNTSQTACLTNSSTTAQNFAFQAIPLSGLFSSSGVVILLLMVALFLGVLKLVMPKSPK